MQGLTPDPKRDLKTKDPTPDMESQEERIRAWERRTKGVSQTGSEVLVRHGARTTQSPVRLMTSIF